MLAAKKRIVIAARLVRGLRLHLRNFLAAAMFIDGDEDQVSAGYVQMRSGLWIFHPDFDTDLERRIEGAIDAGLEDEQIANVNRLNKVDVIHGGGDNVGARVAIGGNGTGEIDEVHNRPPSRLPSVLASLGRITSVISDWVLATVRTSGLASVVLMDSLAPTFGCRGFRESSLPATMEIRMNSCAEAPDSSFGNPR